MISQGEALFRSGNRYRHKEHDSLVFTKGAYYWNSISESGNAIDFLQRHRGMDFMSAVFALTQTVVPDRGDVSFFPTTRDQFSFSDIKFDLDMRRTIAYLNQTRVIDYKLIKSLIDTKMIYQEVTTNNIVNIIFPIYDEKNDVVGAEICGTCSDKRFKGIKSGSKYGYGYSIKGKVKLEYVLFFESAVDLLSFIELEQRKNVSIDNTLLVSMAGLKDTTVKQTLKNFGEGLQPVLCVDNDHAGLKFIKTIKQQMKGIKVFRPEPEYKDWNDQLKSLK